MGALTQELIRTFGTPGDGRWNIMARKDGARRGDCVQCNSHTDVVDVRRGWTFDPFGAEVSEGKIYGRCACDMEGGLAASIIACEAFIENHPGFPGAIEVSGATREESRSYGGVAYLAEQGFFLPGRVDHVILPEPSNKDRICLGHRSGSSAEIETKGEIAHGSMPFPGDCAMRHMGTVLSDFEDKLSPPWPRGAPICPSCPKARAPRR